MIPPLPGETARAYFDRVGNSVSSTKALCDFASAIREEIPTGIEAQVCRDIARRQSLGVAKYGTTVERNPLPLKDWLQHAYEESLDLAIYLRRSITELDK